MERESTASTQDAFAQGCVTANLQTAIQREFLTIAPYITAFRTQTKNAMPKNIGFRLDNDYA